uniref:Anion transporter n=1 Tax=Candidatus Nitrotoga fabula TaxID=2182327 RepID=A0A2X0QTS9_9PROT|nr:Anion transporter [Candidatus Nitrotoga fabula]
MLKISWSLILGPLLALIIATSMNASGWDVKACWTSAIVTLCVVWWIFEPIPIPATSIIPLAVFPLIGVLTKEDIARAYGDDMVLLMLGGFMISAALAHSGTHHRLAVGLIRIIGGYSSRRIVFGFLCACAFISIWISNTATTLMMLPLALAVIDQSEDKKLAIPLLLSVAYGSSIGGLGSPIGTPPNLVFMREYESFTGITVGFTQWMSWGVPVILLMVPLTGLWLTRHLHFKGELMMPPTGPWRSEERRMLLIFGLTVLTWITRNEPFGGWSLWLNLKGASDATVALIAVLAMFLIPNGRGGKLLDWDTAVKVPWGILILFAAGIAIAQAFVETGLSKAVGEQLTILSGLHPLIIIAFIAIAVTFLTETTSNTATVVLLMPILGPAAQAANIDPAMLMLPAAMSASYGFMMPVGTAPNAIVFGTGVVPINSMVREGLALNFIGAAVITAVCYWLVG